MPREFSDPLNTYLAGNTFTSVLLLEINTPDSGGAPETRRFTDNPYDLDYAANTYSAQGEFISISETQLNSAVQISSVNIAINALTLSNVQTFATSEIVNQTVSIFRGFIDPNTNVLLGDSSGENAFLLPVPMMNIINGGSHSDAPIAFQKAFYFLNSYIHDIYGV